MKRLPITALVLPIMICLALSVARAENVAARVLMGKREVFCSPAAVYDGVRVLVPFSMLDELGVTASPETKREMINLTSANGRTGEVTPISVGGEPMLPLDMILQITGGEAIWDDDQKTVTILAHLQSVEFVDGTLKINCSFPVNCSTRKWQSKLIVDVPGTRVASEAKEVYVGGPIVWRARLGQYTSDTARVVLDLMEDADIAVESRLPSAQLVLIVGRDLPKSDAKPTPKPVTVKPAQSLPYKVSSIRLQSPHDGRFDLIIETSAKAVIAPAFGVRPPEVELTLLDADVADGADQFDANHPLLKSVKLTRVSGRKPGVKISLALTRISTYETSVSDGAVILSVYIPEKAGGKLAGMTVVVDPGHGGREKGARWESIYEKDLNIKIAKAVKAELESQGARVILTRDGDQTMGLAARSEVAVNNAADLFISVHCNSNGSPGSASGIETYYHMDEPSPRALGYAVHTAVCSATGMCDRRARSDRSLYSSGLGVLRRLSGTGIPGILLECGYLNTTTDRKKLLDPSYHRKLAEGVVAGLKAYVEGTWDGEAAQ
ncbi:MAG: N-acetylmuramoyl-L-alanine amidase family protein [Armatimonadetes bacterium]|nr:N-acetylmuramoyl-L-alanine amidase family protein [Armatimonadota bacterium]